MENEREVRAGLLLLSNLFGGEQAALREVARRIGSKVLEYASEEDAFWRTIGELRRESLLAAQEAKEYASSWLYEPPSDVRIVERDRLVARFLQEVATSIAEQIPMVRHLRNGLLRGTRSPESEAEAFTCFWGGRSKFNAILMVDAEEHGWSLEDCVSLDAPAEPEPRVLSVHWVLLRATEEIMRRVVVSMPFIAYWWLLTGKWLTSLEAGNCVVPQPAVKMVLPTGLHPSTVHRAYTFRASLALQVATGRDAVRRVQAPAETSLRKAIEIVEMRRRGQTWQEIAQATGFRYPSLARRTLERCLRSLACNVSIDNL